MVVSSDHRTERVERLSHRLRQLGWQLATAESCSGGLLAAACTALPGSSDWFERGFVTYSNAAKQDMLKVDPALIAQHGAVSREVALAMVQGALAQSRAQVAVAITGIAGPGGGTPAKPVGTVWIATGTAAGGYCVAGHRFGGDRSAVRDAAVNEALDATLALLAHSGTPP